MSRFPLASAVRRSRRRGGLLFAVAVCLTVITILCGALMKLALAERQQTRLDECKLQAEWLVESGLERAAAKLAAARDYAGETWEIRAEDLAGSASGTVLITVEPVHGQLQQRFVTVRADYVREGQQNIRRSKRVAVSMNVEPTRNEP